MKRLLILAILILALTSIARAQDPCPTCNKGRELVMTPTHNTEDDNIWRSPRRALSNTFYVRFDASVVVTNDTSKRIRRISWETDLVDAATRKPIHTYMFETRKRIGPHEVVTLKKKVEVPLLPTMIAPNQMPLKRGTPNVIRTDSVSKITEIEYTDGSVSSP
jgi:hypothetical protein